MQKRSDLLPLRQHLDNLVDRQPLPVLVPGNDSENLLVQLDKFVILVASSDCCQKCPSDLFLLGLFKLLSLG